jgi:hypothetical protein
MLVVFLAVVVPLATYASSAIAEGTIHSGNAQCDQPILTIDGSAGPVRVPREEDAWVPVNGNKIPWHCGAGEGQINDCPNHTNQLHVHRQKADNPEWLYDCQVKP